MGGGLSLICNILSTLFFWTKICQSGLNVKRSEISFHSTASWIKSRQFWPIVSSETLSENSLRPTSSSETCHRWLLKTFLQFGLFSGQWLGIYPYFAITRGQLYGVFVLVTHQSFSLNAQCTKLHKPLQISFFSTYV